MANIQALKEFLCTPIEFEATAHNHIIRIPDDVPDGVPMRVLLLVDDKAVTQPSSDTIKTLLMTVVEGLDDTDFERIRDFGREQNVASSAGFSAYLSIA